MEDSKKKQKMAFRDERGGALLSILILMAVVSIMLLAAAPDVVQQVQREKERESIRRGEEVAEAIRQYVVFHRGSKLPSSMDDLLEGLPYGTKKRAILRASSAIDPLSEDGKWKLVQPKPDVLARLATRIQKYNNGALPDSPNREFFDRYAVQIVNSLNIEDEEDNAAPADETDGASGDESENQPFIGVVSKSRKKSVLTYYGIENHSKWIFTPLFRGTGISRVTGQNNSGSGSPIIPEDKPRDR